MMGPIMGGRALLKYSAASANIVCDGDSLTAGSGGGPYPTLLRAMAPLNNVVTVSNMATSGHTIANMISGAGDVDAAFVAGKKNILIPWGGTNTLANAVSARNKTGRSTATEMANYITGRKALNPWYVILLTCLPRQHSTGQVDTDWLNGELDAYNTIMRNEYRAMGASQLVDIRAPGSPFNLPNYLMQSFEDLAINSGQWKPGEEGQHIHLNGAGYTIVAQMAAAALRYVPR